MADAWGGSWGGTFIVWAAVEQITAPNFGPPFLDGSAALRTTLGAVSPITMSLGAAAHISPDIEGSALLPSSRISRSAL